MPGADMKISPCRLSDLKRHNFKPEAPRHYDDQPPNNNEAIGSHYAV